MNCTHCGRPLATSTYKGKTIGYCFPCNKDTKKQQADLPPALEPPMDPKEWERYSTRAHDLAQVVNDQLKMLGHIPLLDLDIQRYAAHFTYTRPAGYRVTTSLRSLEILIYGHDSGAFQAMARTILHNSLLEPPT